MPHFIALFLFVFATAAAAADVALIGLIGDKAAVVAIDGGDPKSIKVGQKWGAVSVIAIEGRQATIEVDGKRRVLEIGQHHRARATAADRQSVTLSADPRGHFFSDGAVNGTPVRFLVDTGATTVALPASDAVRLGIDYRKGELGMSSTAGGMVPVYRVRLDTVRLGSIELTGVEGVVLEKGLDIALLGMSFLNRLDMRRDGQILTLTRRF
jgi:aspartyl protease family protein